MAVQFADAYIDRLFADKDMLGLYHLITVLEQEQKLEEEFWLFCRLLEWEGSARSGIWQYYEGLPVGPYGRMSRALDHFGLTDIAVQYRLGRDAWNGPERADSLDRWIDDHQQQIYDAAFDLIVKSKDRLKNRP